jgi:hypothetical protein
MRCMLTGIAFMACTTMIGTSHAQQNCDWGVAGETAGGPVYRTDVVGQPPVLGSVDSRLIGSGGIGTGQPFNSGGLSGPSVYSGQRIYDYSYWVAYPGPSRTYVPYGALDQFPFQGRPYGNPSDRWSWYYMGGGNSRYLARYFSPPLP